MSKENHPLASIIVPVYNSEKIITECLQALKKQTLPRHLYEIIVVDDGSTDQTEDVVEKIGGVRFLTQNHHGPAAARNLGARNAKGEILLFTDSDCVPTENWLEEMLRPFNNPEVKGAKGIYKTHQKRLVPRFVQLEYETKYDRMSQFPTIDFIDTYSAAYRKSLFLANGGFESLFKTPSVEDQEFSFRLARKGYRLEFAPRACVFHTHDETVNDYIRRKWGIGYWKSVMLKWIPEKLVSDSHTLPSQRIQILLLPVIFILFAFALFGYPTFWLCLISLIIFFGFDRKFLLKIARKDPHVLLIAPFMMVFRAFALGIGLFSGFCFPPKETVAAEPGLSLVERAVKRLIDITGGLMGMVLSLPIILLTGIMIKLDSPGPVFFVQKRAGENGKEFGMIKLRTMVDGAEMMVNTVLCKNLLSGPVYKIPGDPRVTRVGKFLRRWSLDELPQFWNVMQGDMSLVGPRPEEVWVVQQYDDLQRKRLSVKPGLTGPMQINGRGDLGIEDRLQLEMEYISHYSLWKDFSILLNSLPVIISGKGAY
jgi:lipopolysaccharide/colanic/teichoic acid biosynthesis glycosyltransferase/glycosyltransferase involved in cell wall biosynthesis